MRALMEETLMEEKLWKRWKRKLEKKSMTQIEAQIYSKRSFKGMRAQQTVSRLLTNFWIKELLNFHTWNKIPIPLMYR